MRENQCISAKSAFSAFAQQMLAVSDLKNSAWGVEHWQPYMLETAVAIAQKWALEK